MYRSSTEAEQVRALTCAGPQVRQCKSSTLTCACYQGKQLEVGALTRGVLKDGSAKVEH